MSEPSIIQLHVLTGKPKSSLGKIYDVALVTDLGALFTKGPHGWTETGRLVKTLGYEPYKPISAYATSTGWAVCS